MKRTFEEYREFYCPPEWIFAYKSGTLEPTQNRLLDAWASISYDLKYVSVEAYEQVVVDIMERSQKMNLAWGIMGRRDQKKLLKDVNIQLDLVINECGYRLEWDPETKRHMLVSKVLDEMGKLLRTLVE